MALTNCEITKLESKAYGHVTDQYSNLLYLGIGQLDLFATIRFLKFGIEECVVSIACVDENGEIVYTISSQTWSSQDMYIVDPEAGIAELGVGFIYTLDKRSLGDEVYEYFDNHSDSRSLSMILRMESAYEDGTTYDECSEFATLLEELYNLKLTLFDIERVVDDGTGITPSDDGINISLTMNCDFSCEIKLSTLNATLFYSKNTIDESASGLDLSPYITDLLNGNSVMITEPTFSNSDDWNFLFIFGDKYENVRASTSIPKAFANLHLSGKTTGGVCFGGFSSSEEGLPKLESYYPAYFYNGIVGVTNYSASEVVTGGLWIDGKPIYRKVFAADVAAETASYLAHCGKLETVIRLDGTIYGLNSDGKHYHYPLSYHHGDSTTRTRLFATASSVVVWSTIAGKAVVVMEYTKAGDSSVDPSVSYSLLVDVDYNAFMVKEG